MFTHTLQGNKVVFVEDAVYFIDQNMLVLSDVHVGMGCDPQEVIGEVSILCQKFLVLKKKLQQEYGFEEFSHVVIAGDIMEAFCHQELAMLAVEGFLSFIIKHTKEVTVLGGNHDAHITELSTYVDNNIFFTHGHVPYDVEKGCKLVVIGHQHPTLAFGKKKEKCYLIAETKDFTILNLPCFSEAYRRRDLCLEAYSYINPYLKMSDSATCYILQKKGAKQVKLERKGSKFKRK